MNRLAIIAAAAAAIASTSTAAQAVVYCKTVGVPKGCVVRPTAVVVYCTAPGVPAGCVARPAAVVRPVGAVNLGGPVNRRGIR